MNAKETVDTGVQQLATIQDTGKRPKLHTLGPLIMLIVGVLWIIAAAKPTLDDVEISGWLITIGFTWYAATKIRVTPQMGAGHIHRLRQ